MDSVMVAGFRVVARRDNDDGHNLWFGCSNTLLVGSSVHRVRLVFQLGFPCCEAGADVSIGDDDQRGAVQP